MLMTRSTSLQKLLLLKSSIPALLASSDYSSALTAVSRCRTIIKEQSLSSLTSLTEVTEQLDGFNNLVVQRLGQEFVDCLLCYDVNNVESNFNVVPKGKLLKDTGNLEAASNLYSLNLQENIKLTVKTTVAECAADASASSSDPSSAAPARSAAASASSDTSSVAPASVKAYVTAMTFPQFLSCLEMLFEQILSTLSLSSNVHTFLLANGIELPPPAPPPGTADTVKRLASGPPNALVFAASLSYRSISELLRVRSDFHSLLSLQELKQLWDACLAFTLELEAHSGGGKAWGLRSTLLTQAKSFVERTHEKHMSNLVSVD